MSALEEFKIGAAAVLGKPFADEWAEYSEGLLAVALGVLVVDGTFWPAHLWRQFEVILAERRAMERWNSTSKKKRRALLKAYPAGQEVRREHRRDRQAKRQARRVVRAAGRRAQRARRRRGGK